MISKGMTMNMNHSDMFVSADILNKNIDYVIASNAFVNEQLRKIADNTFFVDNVIDDAFLTRVINSIVYDVSCEFVANSYDIDPYDMFSIGIDEQIIHEMFVYYVNYTADIIKRK